MNRDHVRFLGYSRCIEVILGAGWAEGTSTKGIDPWNRGFVLLEIGKVDTGNMSLFPVQSSHP